jgi:NADH-quinone oxidoreductase subunit M
MPDIDAREWLLLAPLAALTLWMGVYPETFMAPVHADVAHLDARLAQAKPKGDAQVTAGHPEAKAEEAHAQGSAE